MEQIPCADPAEDFGQRYWLSLVEIKRRRFTLAERRLTEKILDLSFGRNRPDIYIPSIETLALSIGSTPNNLHPVIRALTGAQVLGREERLRTWWLNHSDLWQKLPCDEDINPAVATSAAEATVRIVACDLARLRQGDFFPQVTDAEVQAEAGRARASMWTATGLPLCLRSTTQSASGPSEIQTPDHLKNRLSPSEIQTGSLKNRPSPHPLLAGADARASARTRPGNQVLTSKDIPGNQVHAGEHRSIPSWKLEPAGWRLVQEIVEYCVKGGNAPFTPTQLRDWSWRAFHHPLRLEGCFADMKAHIREGRRPTIQNRAGWLKRLWNQAETEAAVRALALNDELAARTRAELAKHVGATYPPEG